MATPPHTHPMHGEYKMPGGKLVVADLAARDGRLVEVAISGDFFLEPDSVLNAINRALTGSMIALDVDARANVIHAALPAGARMFGVSPEAVAVAVARALGQLP